MPKAIPLAKGEGHRFQLRYAGKIQRRVKVPLDAKPDRLIDAFYSYLLLCGFELSRFELKLVPVEGEGDLVINDSRAYRKCLRKDFVRRQGGV